MWLVMPWDNFIGRPRHRFIIEDIENPFIQTKVNLVSLKEADLSISAELVNYTNKQGAKKFTKSTNNSHFAFDN